MLGPRMIRKLFFERDKEASAREETVDELLKRLEREYGDKEISKKTKKT